MGVFLIVGFRKIDIDPEGIICSVRKSNAQIDKHPDKGLLVNKKYAALHDHILANHSFYQNNYFYDEEAQTFFHAVDLPDIPADFIERDCREIKPNGKRKLTWYGFEEFPDGSTKLYPETLEYEQKIKEEKKRGGLTNGNIS